ncbi:glycerate kinase [Maribacter confluentis]|uniref:Glycerate kinase n=1 Tax=Maribacter confluentis TaxID=1656093 RepID=A0ABT8RMN3_9FLAO|nr:glycerate kinase [Maribacter confluentis]MDO1512171.1 glycerate kinase [Maribacter confluentis]
MNIVVAPDSFKECLSSKKVASAIAKSILNVMPSAEVFQIPISDGGEGLLDAILSNTEGKLVSIEVLNPLAKPIRAVYAILNDKKTAIIEMAKASGLELLSEQEKNPLITTTYGTGQLIKDALDKGCTKIIIGIGGSATNDGGKGLIKALGGKFLNANGEELPEGGGNLNQLASIDISDLDKRIGDCEILVACDVSNPLTGTNGASWVYGKQKGGSKSDLELLDANLVQYAKIIKRDVHKDIENVPGAGAAGGTGAAILAFLNGKLVNGIGLILDTIGMEDFVKKADLVITGEGKIDEQTLHGKTIAGIAKMAQQYHVPVIILTGKIGNRIEGLYKIGVSAIYAIANQPMSLDNAIKDAPILLQESTANIMRTIKAFRKIQGNEQ